MLKIVSLIKKDLILLFSNKQTRASLFMPVFLQLALFPFAANLNLENATLAIKTQFLNEQNFELISYLTNNESFKNAIFLQDDFGIQKIIQDKSAVAVVNFDSDFSKDMLSFKTPTIGVIFDGRSSNSAQIANGYINQIVNEYFKDYICKTKGNCNFNEVIVRNWFNPNLDYKYFTIPSLVALVTTTGVLIITALSIAKEKELGTLDQLRVSPLSTSDIFIAKSASAIIIALIQASIVLFVGVFLYKIAFNGSLFYLFICTIIYCLSLVGFGLFISVISKNQQQAFIGTLAFIMPTIMLSGYVSPVENMPKIFQIINYINPIQYFLNITKGIYLKNASLNVLWQDIYPLIIIIFVVTLVSYYLFKKKLG